MIECFRTLVRKIDLAMRFISIAYDALQDKVYEEVPSDLQREIYWRAVNLLEAALNDAINCGEGKEPVEVAVQ